MDAALAVWEAFAEGDAGKARSLLERHRAELDPEDAADLEAMLDGKGDEVAVEALETPTDFTHPALHLASRPPQPDPIPFSCLVCGGAVHRRRRYLLNSRFMSMFGWDEVDPGASCLLCMGCGHIHWFLAGAPGALQVGAPPARVPPAGDFGCRSCGWPGRERKQALLSGRLLTGLGLEFLGPESQADACQRCGLVHWSRSVAGATPWAPVPLPMARQGVEGPLACLGCAGTGFEVRKALLNTRLMTNAGLDWSEAGGRVAACSRCGALLWFLRESPFLQHESSR